MASLYLSSHYSFTRSDWVESREQSVVRHDMYCIAYNCYNCSASRFLSLAGEWLAIRYTQLAMSVGNFFLVLQLHLSHSLEGREFVCINFWRSTVAQPLQITLADERRRRRSHCIATTRCYGCLSVYLKELKGSSHQYTVTVRRADAVSSLISRIQRFSARQQVRWNIDDTIWYVFQWLHDKKSSLTCNSIACFPLRLWFV